MKNHQNTISTARYCVFKNEIVQSKVSANNIVPTFFPNESHFTVCHSKMFSPKFPQPAAVVNMIPLFSNEKIKQKYILIYNNITI